MDKSIGDEKTIVSRGLRGELAAGTKLGRYRIIKLLGRGGMGQVYLVQHELQKSLHALKILPPEFSSRPGFVERFQTELQTMARLQHENIVHVTHSDEENGLYYLVMDFIAADDSQEPYDLEEALAEHGRLDQEVVRTLILLICEGLAHAHSHGVVHRDIKPANVLLTSKDVLSMGHPDESFLLTGKCQAKITDFGLAKVVGETHLHTLVAQSIQQSMSIGDADTFVEKKREERSSTGSVLGTYGYMSPEQEEGKPATERSDIYALGVMMYRMITGQRLRGRAKAASSIVTGLDKSWDGIIDRCLEIDPENRFQSVEELKSALAGGRRVFQPQKNTKRVLGGLLLVGSLVAAAGFGMRWKAERDIVLAEAERITQEQEAARVQALVEKQNLARVEALEARRAVENERMAAESVKVEKLAKENGDIAVVATMAQDEKIEPAQTNDQDMKTDLFKLDDRHYYTKKSLSMIPENNSAHFSRVRQRFKKTGGRSVYDEQLKKTWVLYDTQELLNYEEATRRAQQWGGRLPTEEEIVSLLTLKRRENDWARLNGDIVPVHRTTHFWMFSDVGGLFKTSLWRQADFSDGTIVKGSSDDRAGVLVLRD